MATRNDVKPFRQTVRNFMELYVPGKVPEFYGTFDSGYDGTEQLKPCLQPSITLRC